MAAGRSKAGGLDRAKPVLPTQLIHGDIRSGASLTDRNDENSCRVAGGLSMGRPDNPVPIADGPYAVRAFSPEGIASLLGSSFRALERARPGVRAWPRDEPSSQS
jgi:hypothetical protein